ncbi:hypothetical protein DM02DRAFT_708094 [Periconia macrospinosa]|uniref:Trichothecene 3-O-acetyltransferase n=1 Tax=Periconia macrospinosa TaxID=97972 RepID=A0A2V1DRH0_9PLEO|nr:hypothetical protein DM02DRAFT_708094 [Periconia macrospinosa]
MAEHDNITGQPIEASNIPTSSNTPLRYFQLSTIDQTAMRSTIRFLLCFQTPPGVTSEEITHTLKTALYATTLQMPYLAGRIRALDERNRICIVYEDKDIVPCLVVDKRNSMPSYEELKAQKFPPSALDENNLYLLPYYVEPTEGQNIFAVQANLLNGGLLLGISLNHSVADGAGFGLILKALAKNLKLVNPAPTAPSPSSHDINVDFTEAEPTFRAGIFPEMAPETMESRDYSGFNGVSLRSTTAKVAEGAHKSIPCTWRLFLLPTSSLQRLKQKIMSMIDGLNQSLGGVDFVSSNDVLGALIWQCITRARSYRLNDNEFTQMVIPVDCREKLTQRLPKGPYAGNVALCSMTKLPIDNVKHLQLSELAMPIRRSILALDETFILGLVARINAHDGNVQDFGPKIDFNHGNDIVFNSWRQIPVYDLDFGHNLGKVDWFRTPAREVDGSIKILPTRKKQNSGEGVECWELLVELEERAMENLLKDELRMEYVSEVLQ